MLQNYLSQLITDMHEAKLRVPVSKVPEGVFDPDYQDELEASPDRRMSEWFGLETELFPLSEMLTAEELKLMADEFEECGELTPSYLNFRMDYPINVAMNCCVNIWIILASIGREGGFITLLFVIMNLINVPLELSCANARIYRWMI